MDLTNFNVDASSEGKTAVEPGRHVLHWQGEEEADPSKISTILEEDKKDAKYKYVEIFGYRIKEMKLMGHL